MCGAVVMSFEILGSRVLAPNFGNSVFVWGSLISVFLAGLSAGYYLGGRFADLQPSSRKLAAVIAASAVLLMTFPLYSTAVCDWIFDQVQGVRLSPLLASLILFFIPSVFIGAVSPYTARLMICSLHTSGKTIGSLYALSTLGSIAGTLLTSFYLIAIAGVKVLIVSQGVLLLVISIPLYFMNLRCEITDKGQAGS
jgi:hypothetical protein